MLFVCYGMSKSASTFAFQLSKDIARTRRDQEKLEHLLPANLYVKNRFIKCDLGPILKRINTVIPDEEIYVLKTHCPLDEETREMIFNDHVKAIVSFRDPYDIAVSLKDAGEVERGKQLSQQRRALADVYSYDNALKTISYHIASAKTWLDFKDKDLYRIPFSNVADEPFKVAKGIAKYMGLQTDVSKIVTRYISDKKNTIGEFNIGKEGRGKRLNLCADYLIKKQMDEFIREYL